MVNQCVPPHQKNGTRHIKSKFHDYQLLKSKVAILFCFQLCSTRYTVVQTMNSVRSALQLIQPQWNLGMDDSHDNETMMHYCLCSSGKRNRTQRRTKGQVSP